MSEKNRTLHALGLSLAKSYGDPTDPDYSEYDLPQAVKAELWDGLLKTLLIDRSREHLLDEHVRPEYTRLLKGV